MNHLPEREHVVVVMEPLLTSLRKNKRMAKVQKDYKWLNSLCSKTVRGLKKLSVESTADLLKKCGTA